MDDQLRRQIHEMAQQLLAERKSTFREATTLLDLEELIAQVGDELPRQLANMDLSERAEQTSARGEYPCPDCGRICPVEKESEPLILQGVRGEIEYSEPRCHCRSCRRDFFPNGGSTPASGA